jgi:AraC-like DNA-binding protein
MYGYTGTPITRTLLACGSRIIKELDYDRGSRSVDALPELIGTGALDSIALNDDFLFVMPKIESICACDGLTTITSHDEPRIGFCLAREVGDGAQCWLDGWREREAMRKRWTYINSTHTRVMSYFPPLSRVDLFAMFVDPGRLREAIDDSGKPSARLALLFDEAAPEPVMLSSPSETSEHRIASQIESNPFEGGLGRLYSEAKALELCAILLSPYFGFEGRAGISSKDTRKMDEIRDFIDERLGNPPSLREIAEIFGISLSKLKRDFKKVNGLGVHEYAIEKRLEIARQMISKGSVSIKQASFVAGYKSTSQFSAAYKRRFGKPPNSERKF